MAVIAKQRYKLDIAPKGGWVIVYASQHDNGAREIEFEITNQGNAFSIPASINVSVQGIKSNKSYFSHSCSYSGNIVTMALADDMTDVIGKAICVLKFTNQSNQKLATAKFVLNIDTDSSSEGIIIDTDAEEIFNQMLNDIRAQAASISADIAELQSMVGSPLVASTVSAMTDHNKIYVYTGSELGYTNGNWYYWNGSAWTSGGVYNAVAFETDTTLTQPGQAADAKVVGDKLTNLKEDLTQTIPNPTWTDGYISTTSAVVTSSNYQYSSPIQIDYGRIVVTLTDDTVASVVARYNEDDGTYTSLLAGDGVLYHKQYVYDVTEPGKYVISYRKANGISNLRIITSPQLNTLPSIVEGRTTYSSIVPYNSIAGSYISSDGKYANSNLYAHTNVMTLTEGVYHIAAYGTTPVSILTSCDEAGNNRTSVIVADGSSEFDYTVSTEGYYIFSYRIEQGLTITRISSVKEAIKYNEKEINAIKENFGNLEFKSTLLPVYTVGRYVNTYGQIISSPNYSYSSPILIKRGILKVKCYADTVTAVISKTNAQGDAYTPVVLGEGISTLKTYSYEVTKEGYYCVSFRSASADATVSVELNLYDELERIEKESTDSETSTVKVFKQDTITPNFTIKAFKTLNYSDGTTNKYSQVLWCDEATDTYYLSDNVYSEKHQIFTWDSVLAGNNDSSMYQAVILANGDILFVFQTQFKNSTDDTAQGAYRRNPIICKASEGFELSEIDFGNSTKPTGWLQNVGAFYSYTYNRLFIAEYTRANEQYARVWAVDMPVTTVSNWTIILEKEIPTPYQVGFKHFHSCQEDPFTSILYFSSGDNDLSSAVWYSTDGGYNLTQLDNYNAGKYRMLNMAFTKDYVYWASDQWSPNHFLWRCARDSKSGVLDISTLTKLVTFNDEVVDGVSRLATYTTVYMSCYNCLIMLDRDDSGIHTYIPIRAYDIASGEMHEIARVLPLSAGVTAGFRNVAVTCYVKNNEIVCSYDKKLVNYNKVLGNNSVSRINNFIMRIYKNGTDFTVDFDTVY